MPLKTHRKILVSAFLIVFIAFSSLHVYADDASDLKAQIEERNKNIAELQKEIAAYQLEADKTSAKAKTLQSSIQALTLTGKKLDSDVKLTQTKIDAADLTIEQLSGQITEKETRISSLKDVTALSLKLIHQEDQNSFLETFLSTRSLAQSFDLVSRLTDLTDRIQARTNELQGLKINLQADVKTSEDTKSDLLVFEDELSDKQKAVNATKSEQNKLFTETKNSEVAFQAIIADKAAKKAAFEKELFEYESKLNYILNPDSIPKAGSAVFSWPTDNPYLTQNFGVTSASGRLYASGSHNGVDFKALMGTPIKAILSGTVIGTGNTDLVCPRASFGQWILIKNDNGLSEIYAHLSVIKVSEGQRVSTGQVIALSGNTGYSTGPHLHISVYAANAVTVQNRPSISCGKSLSHANCTHKCLPRSHALFS